MLLPTYDVFDETRYFQPAHTQHAFLLGAETLGITICEDIWNDKNFWTQRLYERDPVTELVGKGSSIVLNISSSPYTIDKRAIRHDMLRAMAKRHQVPVVYVNQVGGNDSLIFDGSSVAFLPDGSVAALAKSFEEDLVFFDSATGSGDIRPQITDEIEAAYRALVVGTRDYVRKCGFRKVVIGLSGGIDSALVAAIAADALGRRKCHRREHAGAVFIARAASRMRKCLAKNLGIELLLLPIGDTFQSYRQALARHFCRTARRCRRRKSAGAHSRQSADGALEQVRLAGAEHRQQIRNGCRILHALRRHGGRARGHFRCSQNDGLRTFEFANRARSEFRKRFLRRLPPPNSAPIKPIRTAFRLTTCSTAS